MTIYGGDIYGSATAIYGAPGATTFNALPFTAACIQANLVQLNWTMPTGNWTLLRLVRSSWGASVDENDGGVLFELNVGPSSPSPSSVTSYFDVGVSGTMVGGDLPGDRWYDYSLWVYGLGVGLGGANDWVFAGRTDTLVSNDHHNTEHMQNILPSVFTTSNGWAGEQQADTDTQMSRFLSIFGFQADMVRAAYESLLHLHDPDRCPSRVLSLLCAELGVPYEPQLGLSHTRVLLRNALHIHKTKGTGPGVEDFATSLTGWACDLVQGKNVMLDYNDSSAEESVGDWYPSLNCTLAQVNSTVVAPYSTGSNKTNGSFALTSINNGTSQVRMGDQRGAAGVLASCVPVQAFQPYTLSARMLPTTTAVANKLGISWYDVHGKIISTILGSDTTSVIGTWTQVSLSTTSPSNAAFAAPIWQVQTSAVNQTHYLDAVQLEVSATPTSFQEARQLQLYMSADRTNYVPNPSFEVDTALWVVTASTTAAAATSITRVTTDSAGNAGTCCAEIVTPGSSVNEGATTVLSNVLSGQDYMVTAYVKPETGRPVVIRVRDVTNGGVIAESSAAVGAGWQRLNVHFVTGPATATVSISITTDDALAAASTFRVDGVMMERGIDIRDYFDASTVGVSPEDYQWGGTPHQSISYFYDLFTAKSLRLTELLPDYLWPGMTFTLITGTPPPDANHLAYGNGAYGIDQFG